MAIDKLQEKIRKMKNPSMVDFSVELSAVPPHILEKEGSAIYAYEYFCMELMDALKGIVPSVRFGIGHFALMGPEGLLLLQRLTARAKELEFYVLLDGPDSISAQNAELSADTMFGQRFPQPVTPM